MARKKLENEAAVSEESATLRYIAYADFEQDGRQYFKGDEFIPPADWQRDFVYDEFRVTARKNSSSIGIAFSRPGEFVNKKNQERLYHRVVLPLTEA